MKNRNVKVIDEHNIDRNANVMFALELDGSEYAVYWIERDQDSNNVFVSKVLKNIDGTYNMLNIDDTDKKKDVSEIVKMLITNAVSDQSDKMTGTSLALSNGKVVKFTDVSFNKEQNINVSKTYITTVKKEVTKVAETYYDVVVEEMKVADVLPSVTPVTESSVEVFPQVVSPAVDNSVVTPVTEVAVVQPTVLETPVAPATPEVVVSPTPVVVPVTTAVVEPITVQTPIVQPTPVIPTPVSVPEKVVAVTQTPVVENVVATPAVNVITPAAEPAVVVPAPAPVVQPAVQQPVVTPEPVVVASQPLVFNASGETNLNAALGEVANSTAIPVENIQPVREFGVDAPVSQPTVQQPVTTPEPQVVSTNVNTGKAGFVNHKFFMVVAIAFFLASCIFLGYEVYNYFQLVK